ncbi:Serum response factor-binding protein 1 [Trichinella pseudospiralis]|uniref:Serum response factor-binding protein 1 n=1 Tax=Trichinella pseudospiralis TaxID=6337 RepID=A0A0V1E2F2_TRIPS|nr:Serum response factor-binding protein 1 [Trichinella pseudospiralis]
MVHSILNTGVVCVVVIVIFTGVVSFAKEKYKTLPLNEQTKSILEKLQHDNAISALLGGVATKIGAKLSDEDRKARLCACVYQAQDVHQYAECLVPYAKKTVIRSKRTTSFVESAFNWLAWLTEKVNSVLFSKSSTVQDDDSSFGMQIPKLHAKSSRMKEEEEEEEASTRKESTHWSAETYWSNFWYKITTSEDDNLLATLLPEWPIPDWLREMTKDVHQLIKEMKRQQEAWPEYRILSPRLFPWAKRSSRTVNLLSPDVLSLSDKQDNDNDTERSVSVGKLIDQLNLKERLALVRLVEQLDRLVDHYQRQQRDFRASKEKEMEKLFNIFNTLEQSYTVEQMRSIQNRGYAFLSEKQLRLVYEDGQLPVDIDSYRTMTVEEKTDALESYLLQLSTRPRRSKRSEISVGETIVLSPFIGSPTVGSASVLGPVVLSPAFFSKIVLSPITLSPNILSPAFFTALVLTPIVASPLVLSPQILSPFVLSPIYASPIILSPLILAPSILTPLVSSPLVDTVSMLSLNVLSPTADSPSIRSHQFMVATILSPAIRSPVINSSCYGNLLFAFIRHSLFTSITASYLSISKRRFSINSMRHCSKSILPIVPFCAFFPRSVRNTVFRWTILLTLIVQFGNVICKTDFLKIPVNEEGKTLVDGIMYQRTINLLISTLVTNELRNHDQTETERLINCTSKAHNIADHASCHIPYLKMSIDRIDKHAPGDHKRVKRSTPRKESSTLERLFNWLTKLFREMKKYSTRTLWKGSAEDEQDLESYESYDVDLDINLGTDELMANVERAIAENNFESLLPDMPLPGWFRELAYDVFELIKDMKVIEDIPPLRVLSPRILALTPDANRTIDLLSPDLLSLYEDGSKNVFPTKQSKQVLSRRERDALLNLILELGNVPKLVRDIKKLTISQRESLKAKARSTRAVKLEEEEALVELVGKFKLLNASLTRKQRRMINSTGYAFLNSDQIRLMHNRSLSEEKLFEYTQMSETEKELWLREELTKIAEEKQLQRRQRSANKSEEVEVLHPMVQGPRGDEPLVAGHVILNPKIFSPVVLSPNMVSSSILSPLILSPIVLSPMAVNPILLSPGMLNPLILSPAVLSPLILSPVLLIPSILSPGAFNPSILSPTLLTAAVLSPSALSPVIRSPHRLFAAVLSPSYMSPSINSTCSACAIVASPCFLC